MTTITSTCKKTQSYSFCKRMNHRITKFSLKDSYGKLKDSTELIKYLSKLHPFSILPEADKAKNVTADVSCQSRIKHAIVHMMHSKLSFFQ